MYEIWNCDTRSCESCATMSKDGQKVVYKRVRVLLSISDQESAYEKFEKFISVSFKSFLESLGTFDFPFYHIHDVGPQLKNGQAALERGSHFDGTFAYDSTDFLVLLTTADDHIAQLMSQGVSHKAIAQLDKHSDEQILQRVNESLTTACTQVGVMVRTDIPELRKPWLSENHSEALYVLFFLLPYPRVDFCFTLAFRKSFRSTVRSPLFATISKSGLLFYTDDYQQSLYCYRQTPVPKKAYFSL